MLVLLPTSQKKLQTAGQSPFRATRKVEAMDCEVDMHDKKKK